MSEHQLRKFFPKMYYITDEGYLIPGKSNDFDRNIFTKKQLREIIDAAEKSMIYNIENGITDQSIIDKENDDAKIYFKAFNSKPSKKR